MTMRSDSAAPAAWHDTVSAHRWAVVALALLVVLTAAFNLVKFADFFHDDAFISLRYARNLALLGEATWNPGEWVEGYTNPLHIVLSAALIRAGTEGMQAVLAINAVGLVALWLVVWRLTRGLPPGARLAGMATAVSAPVIGWTYGGLETVPTAALVAAGFGLAVRAVDGCDRIGLTLAASALFAAAYLMRPDSLVANLATGLAILAFAALPLRRRLVHFVALGSVSGAALIAHLAVRQAIYGTWMPLTYYAKVVDDHSGRLQYGLNYLLTAPLEVQGMILVAALSVSLRDGGKTEVEARIWRHALMACLPLVLVCAYIVWTGGDHMDFARFLVPATGFIAAATAALVGLLPHKALLTVALGFSGAGFVTAAVRAPVLADNAAAHGAIVGQHLARTYEPGTLVALATAGSTPYFATELRYIDTLGLNDPVIARRNPVPRRALMQEFPGHAKGDGAYVLSRQPDIIILGLATGVTGRVPLLLTDVELQESPEFQACYERHEQVLLPPYDLPLVHKDLSGPVRFNFFRRTCPS